MWLRWIFVEATRSRRRRRMKKTAAASSKINRTPIPTLIPIASPVVIEIPLLEDSGGVLFVDPPKAIDAVLAAASDEAKVCPAVDVRDGREDVIAVRADELPNDAGDALGADKEIDVAVVTAANPTRGADGGLKASRSLDAQAIVKAQSYARNGVAIAKLEAMSAATVSEPMLAFLHLPMIEVAASNPL